MSFKSRTAEISLIIYSRYLFPPCINARCCAHRLAASGISISWLLRGRLQATSRNWLPSRGSISIRLISIFQITCHGRAPFSQVPIGARSGHACCFGICDTPPSTHASMSAALDPATKDAWGVSAFAVWASGIGVTFLHGRSHPRGSDVTVSPSGPRIQLGLVTMIAAKSISSATTPFTHASMLAAWMLFLLSCHLVLRYFGCREMQPRHLDSSTRTSTRCRSTVCRSRCFFGGLSSGRNVLCHCLCEQETAAPDQSMAPATLWPYTFTSRVAKPS